LTGGLPDRASVWAPNSHRGPIPRWELRAGLDDLPLGRPPNSAVSETPELFGSGEATAMLIALTTHCTPKQRLIEPSEVLETCISRGLHPSPGTKGAEHRWPFGNSTKYASGGQDTSIIDRVSLAQQKSPPWPASNNHALSREPIREPHPRLFTNGRVCLEQEVDSRGHGEHIPWEPIARLDKW
jgi:hypothetical protein